jgi:hypothetical protein
MQEFLNRFVQVTLYPDMFFERIRADKSWTLPLFHLAALALWLATGSMVAWGLGVPGDSPVNSALGAQMDVYPFWRDVLLVRYGWWAYPMAAGLIILEMFVITIIWTPIVFLIFRYLGGSKETSGLLGAFQGFVYGLTPCIFGGFLPYLGAITGVYASLLQFYRGPAIVLRNRTCVPYLFVSLFLGLAISRYWVHELL